jgi:polyferredoxin
MISPIVILAPLAAGMAAATAYLIAWAAEARTPLRASTVVFLLLMMVAMVAGAAIYYAHPGTASLVEGFWVASALMSVSVVEVFAGFLEEVRSRTRTPPAPPTLRLGHPRAFFATVIGLVLANELLMGWTFQAAAGFSVGGFGNGIAGFVSGLAEVVNSPWFLFTMSAEMFLTSFLLRRRLSRGILAVLYSQSAIMALSPPALPYLGWVNGSIYLGSALMIGLFVFLMEYLYRTRELAPAVSTYLVRLLGIYAVMMSGIFLWFVFANPYPFALAVVLEMVLFFDLVIRPERLEAGARISWQLRPNWAFSLLATIFVAELFMGALLNAQLLGSAYTSALPALPLSGSVGAVTYNAVYNGFWFVALTTGSTWFLAMMGVEMGALVYFKFRETRQRETRVRLGLMMGCYGAFAVFFPSIYYPLLFPNQPTGTQVPVLGWSMGIGSAPLAVGVFGVILATYAILGAVTVLFGRRAICSVFCTAPLMYQGTTVDAMKSFNHSSPLARKFLSSRFSTAFSTTTAVTMVSLVLASVASYFDQLGTLNVQVLGADPTVFLFAFYFSVLWYVLFVTIPYSGNYNCVTMGWCYTGTISAAFSRLGFFRLKVHDKEVCKRCTTMDCAKSCPVGLVDMPGHFRQKGEFRSAKCCGVGDCIEACPYGNMYFYDARHWVRARLGIRDRPRPVRLPMFRATAAGRSTADSAPGLSAGSAPARAQPPS